MLVGTSGCPLGPFWGRALGVLESRDALEGQGPQRRPLRRFSKRLEEAAKAVGGGYSRLQMPWKLALGVRETVAGHRLGALKGGVGVPPPPFQCIRTPKYGYRTDQRDVTAHQGGGELCCKIFFFPLPKGGSLSWRSKRGAVQKKTFGSKMARRHRHSGAETRHPRGCGADVETPHPQSSRPLHRVGLPPAAAWGVSTACPAQPRRTHRRRG